jgi:hypothetical protein
MTARFRFASVPFALAILCIASFGLLLPWLGFYWDDWPSVWFNHMQGAVIFKDVFASDRPLLGRLFMLTMPWLGDSTLGWQAFGLVTRWLTVVALWWSFRLLWPKRSLEVTWVAFLFMVYPGFSQQWIAVTYSHVFLTYAVFLFSFGLMIQAVRQPRLAWLWRILAILVAALVMFSHEYFFGLELLRPVFLWIVLTDKGNRGRKCLWSVVLNWLPYLIAMSAFVVWRLFIHEFPRAEISLLHGLQTDFLATILLLGKTVLHDIVTAGVVVWGRVFQFVISTSLNSRIDLLSLALAILGAGITILYLTWLGAAPTLQLPMDKKADRSWALQAAGIGLFALLVAGWPAWVTALPIRLEFPWDRFTLSMMVGASLLFVGLLSVLFKGQLPKIILIGITVGLAVGFHFQSANAYRKEWEVQKAFFWQMVWRIPALAPGTTLFTDHLPFVYYTDNSLTAPLNWTYDPDNFSHQMSYLMYDNQVRHEDFSGFKQGVAIERDYRATRFSGSTDKMLVFFFSPPACLRILELKTDSKIHKYPPSLYEAMPLSNMKLVKLNPEKPALPPGEIFGKEPVHDWCYYFERASIAQQVEDWEQVIGVGEQAFKDGYFPADPVEYLPIIEGYANTGQWDKAQDMSYKVFQEKARLSPVLCALWERIEKEKTNQDPVREVMIMEVNKKLECPSP